MIDKELLAQHLEYSLWATQRVLEAAKSLAGDALTQNRGNSFGGILDTLAHIYQADRIWLARFEGEGLAPFSRPGDNFSLEQLSRDWPPLMERFTALVRAQDDLLVPLDWRNLKGEDKSEKKYKILLHIVNHGTYHRGQVITMLKQAGGEVVSTDLVYYPGM
jgi:uncharacterized damage-inducible protein DinB